MHVVIYDFAPVADTLMGELVQMHEVCITYEDLIDLALVSRDAVGPGHDDYMVDLLCDERDITIHDRQLVRSAYRRLAPYVYQCFPSTQGVWVCCGFVDKLGYFINNASYDVQQVQAHRTAVRSTLQSSRGFYDSGLRQQRL